jgi:hypothetical protein
VEQTLAENEDSLKERTLGIEVFHRPADYDTNLDPVVRLCAVEVRKRLFQYYESPAHVDELRIELNPGSYIPVFLRPSSDAPALEMDPGSNVPILPQPALEVSAVVAAQAEVPSKTKQVSQPLRTRGMLDDCRDVDLGHPILEVYRETKARSRRSVVTVAHQRQACLVLHGRHGVFPTRFSVD